MSKSLEKSIQKDRDLFSVHGTKKKSKKVKVTKEKQDQKHDSDDEQLEEFKKIEKQTKKFHNKHHKNISTREKVSYETLSSGTVVGGCVSRVTTEYIVVSLPYRMLGYVLMTHVSEPYTKLIRQVAACNASAEEECFHSLPELYRPGQYLTVAALKKEGSIKPDSRCAGLSLSLNPGDVNGDGVSMYALVAGCVVQCAVTATEDHGYTLDTGVRGVKAAFLPSADVPRDLTIGVGSVLQCVVTIVRGSESDVTVTMSASAAAVAAAKPSGLVVPGAVVQAIVAKSESERLVMFLGTEEQYYKYLETDVTDGGGAGIGIVSRHHLRGPFDQCHLFRTGQKLQGRVLFVTSFPRTVHITLNRNYYSHSVSSGESPLHGLSMGDIIPEAAVVSATSLGLYLRLSDKCLGFCNSSKMGGTKPKTKKLPQLYPRGRKVSCKIMAYNYVDQIFLVTMDKRIIQNASGKRPNLTVGQVVPVTVTDHTDDGVKVATADGVFGFVFKNHLTNTNMAEPQHKLLVGKTVPARVLMLKDRGAKIHDRWSVYFTLKTLLVESELPLVTDINEKNIDIETHGTVFRFCKQSVIVTLCQEARAVLPFASLPEGINPGEAFEIGQVIRVKLTGIMMEPEPAYFCCHMIIKKKRKREESNFIDISGKRSKIVEENRQKITWLNQFKTTLSSLRSAPNENNKSIEQIKEQKQKTAA